MDNIMNLKTEYMKITDSQIKDLLQSQIKLIDYAKNKQSHHCNEDEIKMKELTSKITSMRESLQSEQQTLEYKNYDLSKHLDYIVTILKKISLYEELTGIHWDYERLKESVAGYKKKYIHYFCYTIDNAKDFSNLLWQEIHQSIQKIKTYDKENIIGTPVRLVVIYTCTCT
ncbi:PREDICTED: uncharacterized protein LOC108574222 [Habropoda laboriosa]|uniref:uncharacterized protein LOC108574222 n=1 Tax=Habropoda laboriosa TaxID=597456 RepID=UPI00083E0EBB|nr:PREDICTED: uncharacterized protein LOC108574222 [Habropoda laboriosa]